MVASKRVCVIGAGPSGMSVLRQFSKIAQEGGKIPVVICYESQEKWGGQWNFNPYTGIDENGEPVLNSMYQQLWSNAPKEALEYPEYTFKEHFGKDIPSYPPRQIIRDYLQGFWESESEFLPEINFKTAVKSVDYKENEFHVLTKNVETQEVYEEETFDYVINATGHFSYPNIPQIKGIGSFKGRLLHVHDFRCPQELTGKKVLVIGSSYSAEDMVIMSHKFGASKIAYSYRTNPWPYKLPERVEAKPLVTSVNKSLVSFSDDSSDYFDMIILCTGYRHYYPALANELQLKSVNSFYPDNLYNGVVWMKGGDNRMLYMGAQDLAYSFPLFELQARWIVQYIQGKQAIPKQKEMEQEIEKWLKMLKTVDSFEKVVGFQTDYLKHLANLTKYPYEFDATHLFHEWYANKNEYLLGFRNAGHKSLHSKSTAPKRNLDFAETLDVDSEVFLKNE